MKPDNPHTPGTEAEGTAIGDELDLTRRLDVIQSRIWARIYDEAQKEGVKLNFGNAYALGASIKEVLHPEVEALIEQQTKQAYRNGYQAGHQKGKFMKAIPRSRAYKTENVIKDFIERLPADSKNCDCVTCVVINQRAAQERGEAA